MQRTPSREPQRIAKLLARAGVASRREIERMIAEGRVAVGGTVIDTPATLLASLHGVTVDGTTVEAAAPARLFVFHKPAGLLTTERDPAGRPTIYDRLPKDLPRLVPVGRLDLNTEGLLLLTTDGELKRQLELPSTGVERTYRARAYGQVSQAQLEDLIDGIEIEGVRYGKIDANLERRTGANVWIEMTLTEGRNREVRRVLEHLGLRVSRLIRTRYGPFILADLPLGEVGEVRQHDLVAFRRTLETPAAKREATAEIAVGGERKRPALRRAPPAEPSRGPRSPAPRKTEVREELDTRRSRVRPPRPAAEPTRTPRGPAPRTTEVREELDTRPPRQAPVRNERRAPPARPASEASPAAPARPDKPKRGAGWAKPKPKPKPGRKPRPGGPAKR